MKNYVFLFFLLVIFTACKKENTITPQTTSVSQQTIAGVWKETFVYNITYKNGMVEHIDTVAVMSNKLPLYTSFDNAGHFESYTLNGTVKSDVFAGSYAYMSDKNFLQQLWPSHILVNTGNTINIGLVDFPLFSNKDPWYYISDNAVLTNNTLQVSEITLQFGSEGNYILQMRKLVKQ